MLVTSPGRRRAAARRTRAIAALALVVTLAIAPAARAGGPPILPGGNPVGSALLGQWFDRYLTLPVAANPAVGNGNPCQRLAAGTVLGPIVQVGSPGGFTCTVRVGTPVFLLGFAAECDNRTPPIFEDEASQLACAKGFLAGVQSTRYTIDASAPVELHAPAFATSTRQHHVTLPPDNIAGVAPGPATFTAYGWVGIVFLAPGRHTIRHDVESDLFTGTSSYNVVVTPLRAAR
ncbi:MAG TPA: hypothetical protein VH834_16145 [Solirubrobacteraceae bacterium]|jgi:hypothetical protein